MLKACNHRPGMVLISVGEPLIASWDGRLPLHLAVADLDRDGHPDLLVTPGDGPSLVYLLDTGKGALRPPTPDEQRRLVLPGH